MSWPGGGILEEKEIRDQLMHELSIAPIILEANVKYRQELKVRDEVIIKTRFEPYKRDQIFMPFKVCIEVKR